MPTPDEIKSNFEINVGDHIVTYKIYYSEVEEHAVKRWNEYSYKIKIKILDADSQGFKNLDIDGENLNLEDAKQYIQTSSGRYYYCYITNFKIQNLNNSKLTFTCEGHAKRISKSLVKKS